MRFFKENYLFILTKLLLLNFEVKENRVLTNLQNAKNLCGNLTLKEEKSPTYEHMVLFTHTLPSLSSCKTVLKSLMVYNSSTTCSHLLIMILA